MSRLSNAPDAAALMTTARSFGNYDLAGALADVIDNSIKARCRNIDIACEYLDDADCIVRIRDDGEGMWQEELIRAMRPASANPNEERAHDDLGRFGWGMKSASFSQCKVLTVVTKKDGVVSAARWDLDNISNWEMEVYEGEPARSHLRKCFEGASGTELIWSNCDRLSEGCSISRDQFNELVVQARRKLSQVFHRYLTGDGGRFPRIHVRINGQLLDELDPFCRQNPATIPLPEEPIPVRLNGKMHQVVMQAFVLPHFSKLSAHDYHEYGGVEGYVRNQGFYVYRNRRLIISGTWFGLAKHGELSKLVRVRIDIPNSLDEMWKITVDKSDAQLPSALKSRMKELVEKFRGMSFRVIQSKGARIDTGSTAPVWERRVRNGVIRYAVNREHPLVSALTDNLDEEEEASLAAILTMVETQVPVDSINAEMAAGSGSLQRGFLSREDLLEFLLVALPDLMKKAGSPAALTELLKVTEPFASNWVVVEAELKVLFNHA